MDKKFKKINKNGSVTIPKEIRAEAGLFSGNGVAIDARPDGSVLITPAAPSCRFCGSMTDILTIDNIIICMGCTKKILSKVDVVND